MTLLGHDLEQVVTTALDRPWPARAVREVGKVTSVGKGVITIEGLSRIGQDELITLEGGGVALALNISEQQIGAVLLTSQHGLTVGTKASATGRQADTPVGSALLSRIVNPLGRPLDNGGRIPAATRWPVERPSPPIIARGPVRRPLSTGLKIIDAAVPIGRGQRELILGDRQTGKTSLALDTILNQGDDVICIYCAIGQRQSALAKVIDTLRVSGALSRTIVVVANGSDPPGLRYLAPYVATSMAEWFMEQGQDTLIVYDDLTRHARTYRELSLLLRRPPGREAYPGDIFYLHARLLERSTQLRETSGGGSLTALPILETQAQNLSAYIPTNLISITDGQIFLSQSLFEKGHLPAVELGRCVSRVGGKAQPEAYRAVAGDLRLYYAQFEELETFARVGTRLDKDTTQRLERGRRVRAILKQNERAPLSPKLQIAVLLAATSGALDDVPLKKIGAAAEAISATVDRDDTRGWRSFSAQTAPSDTERATLIEVLKEALTPFYGLADEANDNSGATDGDA